MSVKNQPGYQEDKPRFSVKVAELTVLWLDFADVDFGMVSEHVLPPLLLIQFLEMNMNGLLVLYGRQVGCDSHDIVKAPTDSPSAVFKFNLLAKLAIEDLIFPFQTDAELLLCNHDGKISGSRAFRDRHDKIHISQFLPPSVW